MHYDGDEETRDQTDMSFLQADTGIPGSDGVFHKNIKCFSCNNMGHYASVYTEPRTEEGVQMLQIAHQWRRGRRVHQLFPVPTEGP